jgi:transposase
MSQITVLTGPERHRRWREDERRQILAAAFAPGASVADVARQYDVATSLIYKWRQQALPASGNGASFTPAVVVDEPACLPGKMAPESETPICVESSDGTRVRIGGTASASLVTATLRAACAALRCKCRRALAGIHSPATYFSSADAVVRLQDDLA